MNGHSPDPARSGSVAVTGIGMMCPLGLTVTDSWEGMLAGRSGIKQIGKFDTTDCLTRIGGELPAEYEVLERERTPKRLFKQTVRNRQNHPAVCRGRVERQ